MSKFVEYIKKYERATDEREKLIYKEAVLFESIPQKHRRSYLEDRGFAIVDSVDELVAWMKEQDSLTKRFEGIAIIDVDYLEKPNYPTWELTCQLEKNGFEWDESISKLLGTKGKFKVTIIVEELSDES